VTDYVDGWVARTFDQATNIGRMLDPIADKLLVAATLLLLAADGSIAGWSLWAAVIILCREILVSGLREYLATLRVSVPVTQVAKWKTGMQLTAIGFLIAGPAGDSLFSGRVVTYLGLTLLWIAAVLTLYTGWDYFRAGVRHLADDEDTGI
jgi:cardiolipin synthase